MGAPSHRRSLFAAALGPFVAGLCASVTFAIRPAMAETWRTLSATECIAVNDDSDAGVANGYAAQTASVGTYGYGWVSANSTEPVDVYCSIASDSEVSTTPSGTASVQVFGYANAGTPWIARACRSFNGGGGACGAYSSYTNTGYVSPYLELSGWQGGQTNDGYFVWITLGGTSQADAFYNAVWALSLVNQP